MIISDLALSCLGRGDGTSLGEVGIRIAAGHMERCVGKGGGGTSSGSLAVPGNPHSD